MLYHSPFKQLKFESHCGQLSFLNRFYLRKGSPAAVVQKTPGTPLSTSSFVHVGTFPKVPLFFRRIL